MNLKEQLQEGMSNMTALEIVEELAEPVIQEIIWAYEEYLYWALKEGNKKQIEKAKEIIMFWKVIKKSIPK